MVGISPRQFRRFVIRPTLQELGEQRSAMEELLVGTVAHESLGGRYLKQVGGRALGVFQIEPMTHRDVWVNYLAYRSSMRGKILRLTARPKEDDELMTNLKYSCAIAYLIYKRSSGVLPRDPRDIQGLAKYWKKYYNTSRGAGTVRKFVRDYRRWT